MEIRLAEKLDFEQILAIYEHARSFMRETGNPTQWKANYPSRDDLLSDFSDGNLYVLFDNEGIHGVFVFIPDADDVTYRKIDGAWLNELPYAAVHKVASRGTRKGILKTIMDYCFSIQKNIKIDTHRDNKIMQHQLEKYGFSPCGIIYLLNGEERLAYQKTI